MILAKIYFSGNSFPFAGNLFYANGMGPIIMTGYDSGVIENNSYWFFMITCLLNVLGIVSFVIISLGIIWNVKKCWKGLNSEHKPILFCILVGILYFLPIAANYFNDRYILFLLPFILYAAITRTKITRIKIKTSLLLNILLVGVSLFLTHDYFAVHNTKWKAINYLVEEKNILTTTIDGGFEFNALHHTSLKNYNPNHTGRWWFIENDNYIISPNYREGYSIVKEYTVNGWLPKTPSTILILENQ